ncbi:MAG TPA: HEPN domain-containing protein [Anaerolineae bacterium]|nr:HEPN domain-containing protein [Anaerolineae bacterium]
MRRDSPDRVQGKRFPPDDPREWLNRARSNLAQARGGAQIAGVYLEDLCFNAQQAAEKGIKAVLIQYGIEFPYVHDLAELLGLVKQAVQEIPGEVQQAARLTRYAVVTRYPGLLEPVTREQYEQAVALAEEVVHWAQEIIERGTREQGESSAGDA